LGEEEIRLSVNYQFSQDKGTAKERIKGKETKRTDSTNRESNNSLSNIIEQTATINKLYKSLIHSISERNIAEHPFSPTQRGTSKLTSPKVSQLLSRKYQQIL
jgi:hypothetical protein